MQAVRQDDRSAVQTTRLAIAKMDCPSEEALIRSNLATLAGVIDLDFNLMQRTLTVRHAQPCCLTCWVLCNRSASRPKCSKKPTARLRHQHRGRPRPIGGRSASR